MCAMCVVSFSISIAFYFDSIRFPSTTLRQLAIANRLAINYVVSLPRCLLLLLLLLPSSCNIIVVIHVVVKLGSAWSRPLLVHIKIYRSVVATNCSRVASSREAKAKAEAETEAESIDGM